jgi:hypothetical protein
MLAYIPAPGILWVEKLPISATGTVSGGDRPSALRSLRWTCPPAVRHAQRFGGAGGRRSKSAGRNERIISRIVRGYPLVTVYSLRTWTSPIEIDEIVDLHIKMDKNAGFPVRYVSSFTKNGGSIPHGESIDKSLGKFPSIPPRWSLRWSSKLLQVYSPRVCMCFSLLPKGVGIYS